MQVSEFRRDFLFRSGGIVAQRRLGNKITAMGLCWMNDDAEGSYP
jgi:hypothetical protein